MSISFDSDTARVRLSQSMPIDIIAEKKSKKAPWGIEGYSVPRKTQLYISKEYKIPKSKVKSVFAECEKRSREPGPPNYSPSSQQTAKRYWERGGGKFTKSKKTTAIQEEVQRKIKFPGPGAYNKIEKGKVQDPPKTPGGIFSKTCDVDFLSTSQCLAEENPGVGKYFSTEEKRTRAFSLVENKTPTYKYPNAKPPGPKEKSAVGPGYLKELENAYSKDVNRTRTPKVKFAKSRNKSTFTTRAELNKFVPGVGHYKDVDKAYTSHSVVRKNRTAYIAKHKMTRFTEDAAKNKKWVPGPGAYDILPAPRTKSG